MAWDLRLKNNSCFGVGMFLSVSSYYGVNAEITDNIWCCIYHHIHRIYQYEYSAKSPKLMAVLQKSLLVLQGSLE